MGVAGLFNACNVLGVAGLFKAYTFRGVAGLGHGEIMVALIFKTSAN